MKPLVSFSHAVNNLKLLGAALGDPATFQQWITCFTAAFGEELNREQRRAFESVAGSRLPPQKKVQEFWAIVGRRGGKTRMAALVSVFIALCVDWSETLVAGELGYVLCLSASREQAKICFNYCLGFIESSPIFSEQLAEDPLSEEIRLKNGIVIATHVNSHRTVRGRTILACVFDESAFWRDENSASPDVEVYRAVIPAIIASGGMLIGISSAYRRAGLLFAKFRDWHGIESDKVLVVRGTSEQFNPTLNSEMIAAERLDDPESAAAEWDSEFRSDLSQFLDDELIDAAVAEGRPLELSPNRANNYVAFADAGSGRHDAYCVCIGHREENRIVADVVRRKNPPFNPADTTKEFADLVKDYSITRVTGDNWAAGWVSSAWEREGLHYTKAEKPKSQLYIDGLPAFTRGQIEIPNDPTLIRELRSLERRTSRGGRDTVSDPPGNSSFDDSANSLFGMIHLLREQPKPQPIKILTMDYR